MTPQVGLTEQVPADIVPHIQGGVPGTEHGGSCHGEHSQLAGLAQSSAGAAEGLRHLHQSLV